MGLVQDQSASSPTPSRLTDLCLNIVPLYHLCITARAGKCRFGLLSTLRAHTKVPSKIDLQLKTLRTLNRPGLARTGVEALEVLRRDVDA
jgi:hypothetical protein